MKRTINKKMAIRLAAQADEADLHESYKIADNLTTILVKYADDNQIRESDEEYKYSEAELLEDVMKNLLEAATRLFDYYDELPDGRDIQNVLDSTSSDFISSFENIIKNKKGKYEEKLPGEKDLDNGAEEEVHWEINFVKDDEDEDEEDRGSFVLTDEGLEEEQENEDEEEEEEND